MLLGLVGRSRAIFKGVSKSSMQNLKLHKKLPKMVASDTGRHHSHTHSDRRLQGTVDRFNGVVVDFAAEDNVDSDLFEKQDLFSSVLEESMSGWKSEERTAAWLKIPISLSHLIPAAYKQGFQYHHAEGTYAMLYQWIGTGEDRVPQYATHHIGVSGFVYNEDSREVLMIQDKHRIARWKFPGGYSNFAEDIPDTAVREVREETGIQTEFQSILAFRQQHRLPYSFGMSDIYVVCRLKPLTFDLNICKTELLDAKWIPVDELLTSGEHTLLTVRVAKLIKHGFQHGLNTVDITMSELESVYKNANYKLFHRPLST